MQQVNNDVVDFADKLIGKEIEVRTYLADPLDEQLTEHPGDVAVRDFQRKQRLMLAEYQNKQELDSDDMVRVDRETAQVTDEPSRLINNEQSEGEA